MSGAGSCDSVLLDHFMHRPICTKRDGSTVAAAEHDLIIEKISDLCVAKHINIVFEQLATEAQELATWATHHRQESSDYFKRIRDNSIEEIDATRSAAHPKQGLSSTTSSATRAHTQI